MADTRYIEVDCKLNPLSPGRDIATALMGELGFESFEDYDQGVLGFIAEDGFDLSALKQLFNDTMVGIDWEIKHRLIPVTNYNELWESNFPKVEVENKLLIRAPFHDSSPSFEQEIIISPKMAFGTGHHETTWLISRDLFSEDWQDSSVLDMGCGTGILAILAKKLGANRAVAIDIDPWSTENTRENLRLNDIRGVEVREGNREVIGDDQFDRILANINRNILLDDLPMYVNALEEKGKIWFSGFLKPDMEIMKRAVERAGLTIEFVDHRNDWSMIRASK